MTRDEAEAICAERAATDPDRDSHQWQPAPDGAGGWRVMKIGIAPDVVTGTALQADERPPTADDPRPANFQNIPPFGGGL